MSLGYKLFYFSVIQHILFLLLALFVINNVIRPHNLRMEHKNAQEKILQIKNVFKMEMEHLNLLNMDWAFWDDTYDFVSDKNSEYIKSNFVDDILESLNLNHMEIFNTLGNSVHVMNDGVVNVELLKDDLKRLKKEFLDFNKENLKEPKYGIIQLNEQIGFISLTPILHSTNNKEPSTGVFLMIRTIDKKKIENINKSTNSNIILSSVKAFSSVSQLEEKDFFIQFINDNKLIANAYLKSMDDKARIMIKSELNRDFFIESENFIKLLFIFLITIGSISFIISFYFVRREIIQPVGKLFNHISEIRKNEVYIPSDLELRKDELGILAQEFNSLIKEVNKKNKLLGKMARMDFLTGLANRMDLEERFDIEKGLSYKENIEFSILMIDIDYFKMYNDTYGHVKGDEVLALVAKAIKDSSLRPSDYYARYGGEEFMALLPKTNLIGSVIVAKRIIKNIHDLNIEHKSTLLDEKRVTVSIGCFTTIAKEKESQEFIIGMADKALYKAKALGRNRFINA